jgi:hypothetical protein
MATLTHVSAEVDDTERADTPEELANLYEHLTNASSMPVASLEFPLKCLK